MLSKVEFHPQWVQKPPTARCAKTSFCGAHLTMQPVSGVASLNPFGNSSIHSEPPTEPGRTTHKNGCPLFASPQAISANSPASIEAKLPKLTYMTELLACLSSHNRQSVSSSNMLVGEAGATLCNGPSEKSGTWKKRQVLASQGISAWNGIFRRTICRVKNTALR